MDIYEIQKKLTEEFALKRIKAEKIAATNLDRAKKNGIYDKLVSLEKQLSLEIAKQETSLNPDAKTIAELEKTLNETIVKKNEYLQKIGLTSADLKPRFECEKCKDTGFVGGEPCTCFKKRKNALLIKECGLGGNELVSFADFNEKIIKDKTQKEDLIKLKNFLEDWCNNFPNVTKKQIVVCGETGLGKTFLAKCMAENLSKKDLSILFISAYEMNNMLLKYHTTFDDTKPSVLAPLTESDVLFIDDLGTEPMLNNVTKEYLFLVLSERERFSLPTIITTNLLPDNISETYGERIYSRLSDKKIGVITEIQGNDIRTQK